MFVYQNKDGNICVTFDGNKPVDAPEYVIAVDNVEKKLYMVSGTIEAMPEREEVIETVEPKIEIPSVEELDSFVENDHVSEEATLVTPEKDVPAVDDIRSKFEDEPESRNEKAPMTTADNKGAPSVEELDGIEENDRHDLLADQKATEVVEDVEEEDTPADEETE